MTDAVLFPQMPPKKKTKVDDEEFTPKHDHMPKFLESLDDLVKLYKEKDDFPAQKSFETAREARCLVGRQTRISTRSL